MMANPSVRLGEFELKFDKEFGEQFEEIARRELRETEDVKKEAYETLMRLIKEEEGLHFPCDEKHMKIFLRPCKFYPHSAMDKIRRYYKFKISHSKYFKDLLPSTEEAGFRNNLFTVFPIRSPKGERLLLVEPNQKWNPKTCSILQLIRSLILILESAMTEERTQVAGAVCILDMYGLGLNHVWQFTPGLAKDILDFVQEALPLRLKAVHIVNQPYIFNMLFAIFKPFINEKLRKRIHFHGVNWSGLHKFIDPACLPKEYDGKIEIPRSEGEKLHQYLVCFEDEFKERNRLGYVNNNKK